MSRTFCNGARLSQVVPQLSATVDGAEWGREDAEHEVQAMWETTSARLSHAGLGKDLTTRHAY